MTTTPPATVPRYVYLAFGFCFSFIGWFVLQYVGHLDERFMTTAWLLGIGGGTFVLGGLLQHWRPVRRALWGVALAFVLAGLAYWFVAPSGW